MRHIENLSEHEMVAAFLKAEIASERFREPILALLQRARGERSIVDEPDIHNQEENARRIRLLGEFRGYRQDRELFRSFPAEVSWHRYALRAEELARVRYIDYAYWNELSGGTRLPMVAANNVRGGAVVFGQGSQPFLDGARALRHGARFPELILVGTTPGADLVVLEGHVRLTAYFLAPDCIPEDLTAIVGFSPGFRQWMSIQGPRCS